MFISVSNSHKADIMDYGKSAVIIECNSLFQSTQCRYATFASGGFIFSSAFLIDLWFSDNKTGRDVLFASCIIRWSAGLPQWPDLSHSLFLRRKEIRPVLVALLGRVCEMLAGVVFMLVYFLNDVRWLAVACVLASHFHDDFDGVAWLLLCSSRGRLRTMCHFGIKSCQSKSQILFCTCCMQDTVLKQLTDYFGD